MLSVSSSLNQFFILIEIPPCPQNKNDGLLEINVPSECAYIDASYAIRYKISIDWHCVIILHTQVTTFLSKRVRCFFLSFFCPFNLLNFYLHPNECGSREFHIFFCLFRSSVMKPIPDFNVKLFDRLSTTI